MRRRRLGSGRDDDEVAVPRLELLEAEEHLLALGSEAVKPGIVIALLAGGVVAAPLAAWLVQKVTARLLGAAVGGLIIITNARTMFEVFGADLGTRAAVYAAIAAVWAIAIWLVVRHHRQNGLPLLNPRAETS